MAPRAYGARTQTSRIGWIRSVGNLAVGLGLDSARFQQGILRSVGALTSLQNIGVAAGFAIGASLVQGLAEATAERAQFENAMRDTFNLLPNISQKAMDDMHEQVRSFARTSANTLADAAEAAYQGISAGMSPDHLQGFLQTADDLSKAWRTDLPTAVTSLATLMNSYGMETSEASEAADDLFTIIRQGVVRGEQLSGSISKLTATTASLGISFDEVGASMSVMTKQGSTASSAATKMTQILVNLARSGGKAANFFEKITGQSFPDFLASGRTFTDVLNVMNAGMEHFGVTAFEVFSRTEAATGFLALTSEAGAKQYNDALDGMVNNMGVAEEAADNMRDTLTYRWQEVKSEIGDAVDQIMPQLINLGYTFADVASNATVLLNVIESLADGLDNLMQEGSWEWLGKLFPALQPLTNTLSGNEGNTSEKGIETAFREWAENSRKTAIRNIEDFDIELDTRRLGTTDGELWGIERGSTMTGFMQWFWEGATQGQRSALVDALPEGEMKTSLGLWVDNEKNLSTAVLPQGIPAGTQKSATSSYNPGLLKTLYNLIYGPSSKPEDDSGATAVGSNLLNIQPDDDEEDPIPFSETPLGIFQSELSSVISTAYGQSAGDLEGMVDYALIQAAGSFNPDHPFDRIPGSAAGGGDNAFRHSTFSKAIRGLRGMGLSDGEIETVIRQAAQDEIERQTATSTHHALYNPEKPKTTTTKKEKTPLELAMEQGERLWISSGAYKEGTFLPGEDGGPGVLHPYIVDMMKALGIDPTDDNIKTFTGRLHTVGQEQGSLDWLDYMSPNSIAQRQRDADEAAQEEEDRKIKAWEDQVRAEDEAWRQQQSYEDTLASHQSKLWGTYDNLRQQGLVGSLEEFFDMIADTPEMLELRNAATRAGETWDDALSGVKEVGTELKTTVDGIFEEISKLSNYYKGREDARKGHAQNLVDRLIAMEVDPQHWGTVGEWFFSQGHFPGLGMMGKDKLKNTFNNIAADMLPFALNPMYDQEELEKFLEGLGWKNPNADDDSDTFRNFGEYQRYAPSTGVLRFVDAVGQSTEGLRKQQCDTTAAIHEQTEVIKKGNQVLHNDNVRMGGVRAYGSGGKLKPDNVTVLR